MEKSYKDTSVVTIDDLQYLYLQKEPGFKEYFIESLSRRLVERLIIVLEMTGETIVKLSDLIEERDYATNNLVLKKEINFQPLVRCGKCARREDGRCQMQPKSENPYWFCADGERRKDG